MTRKIFYLLFLSFILLSCNDNAVESIVDPTIHNIVFNSVDTAEPDTIRTLQSLKKEGDLFMMTYYGDYAYTMGESSPASARYREDPPRACSLFAAYGDPNDLIFGRNFDWDFSPALLLYMDPPDAYASVSMVDIYYLGFGGDNAYGLADLPLDERVDLLDAPYLPFDGINEAGLVVEVLLLPETVYPEPDARPTVSLLQWVQYQLDNFSTTDEVIASDAGMTARLLRIVNSSFYSFPTEIETVARAITVVGMNELCQLALATSVMNMFGEKLRNVVDMNMFWHGQKTLGQGMTLLSMRSISKT